MSPSISMSSPDSSPSRLPVRQKGSLTIPELPKLPLPPLPEITNPAIKNLALTHSSAHSGDRTRKRDLIYNQAEAVLDNEKLEHVGDGLLTAAVITLLHELYPAFGPGPATYLRSHMVSNRSLAQIAEQYGLPEMFIANASSKYIIQAAQKTKGSLFEAYVAGVYYSFLMPREEAESEGSGETIRPSGSRSGDTSPKTVSEEEKEEQEVNAIDKVDPIVFPRLGKGENDAEGNKSLAPGEIDGTDSGRSGMGLPARQDGNQVEFPGTGSLGASRLSNGSHSHEDGEEVKSRGSGSLNSDRPNTDSPSDLDEQVKPEGTGIDDLFSLGLKTRQPIKRDDSIKESEDVKSLIPLSQSPTSTPSASPTPAQNKRTHGQAFDHLCSWLWPLFTPVAEFLSSYLETESSLSLADNCPTPNPNQSQNVPNEWKIEDTEATGAIGALNQYLGKTYGCGYLPTWITKKRVMDVWRMVCIVRTPEGKECRAEGKRLTKKAAMTVAAYKVWQEVKAWEEEQAEKRRAEEENEDCEEGEEEVMMLKERRPKGGRKGDAGVAGEIDDDQKEGQIRTPGKSKLESKLETTDNDETTKGLKSDESKEQVEKVTVVSA